MALKLLWTYLKQYSTIWAIKTWIIFELFICLNGFCLLGNTKMEKKVLCTSAHKQSRTSWITMNGNSRGLYEQGFISVLKEGWILAWFAVWQNVSWDFEKNVICEGTGREGSLDQSHYICLVMQGKALPLTPVMRCSRWAEHTFAAGHSSEHWPCTGRHWTARVPLPPQHVHHFCQRGHG